MLSGAGVASLVVAVAFMAVGAHAGSTLVVNSPAALAVNFTAKYPPHGDIPDSPAMFGIPFYGGSQTGVIVESVPDVGCPGPIDTSSFPDPSFGLLTILLINRGGGANCTFRAKVKACQDAGAVACIITDTQTDPKAPLPIMADDGKAGPSLVTPSAIIRKADGDAIRNTVRQLKAEDGFVSMTISYALPNPDGHVEWDLWTSANDKDSHQFKHEFLQGVRLLGNSQTFTPHYYIIDGNNHGCVKYQWCGKQCTNGGRYCAVDPEQNLNIGLDGEDVIMEDLRQMCVYQYLNQTGDTLRWWNYVNMFGDQCAGSDATWNYTCSDSILTALSIPPTTIAQCESSAGGFTSAFNSVLDAEMKLRVQPSVGIFHFPQLVINNELYWGSMACPDPITVATCGPLTALCSAFSDGTKPAACTGDLDCPIAQTRDACGRCMEQNDPTRVTDPNECDQKGGGGVSLGYVVLVSVVGLLVLGAFVFWCIRRQKREVHRDVTNLLRAYVPLDANTAEQMRREKAAPLSHADGSAAPHDGDGKRDVEKRQLITDREDSQIGVGHITAGAPQSAGGVSGRDTVLPAPADEL